EWARGEAGGEGGEARGGGFGAAEVRNAVAQRERKAAEAAARELGPDPLAQRLLARHTSGATSPGEQRVERAGVEDLVPRDPGAARDGHAEIHVVELGEIVRVGADRERHAGFGRAARVGVVEIEPLR